MKQMDGKPYEKNLMEMVRGTMSLNSGEDLSGVFCSELVAAAYQRYPCHPPRCNSHARTHAW